jgi:hypothetical protein
LPTLLLVERNMRILKIVNSERGLIMPNQHDIQKIRNLLLEAFHLLCINDTDLIDLGDSEVLEYSVDSGKLERKLHEICINHRLAHYIEELLPKYYPNVYKVDIEYNRYYKNKKYVDVEGEKKTVRPDIIVHTRAKQTEYPQHLLVIEAKKDIDCPEDIKVIKSFIKDRRYRYIFGLAVRYNDFNPVETTLFYEDTNENIQNEKIIFHPRSV